MKTSRGNEKQLTMFSQKNITNLKISNLLKLIRVKKTLFISIIITLFIATNTFGQAAKGSGKLKTESFKFNGFKHLVLNGSFRVVLLQGNEEGIKISTDDNLVNLFQTRMDKETLYVTMLADVRKFTELNVYISYRELKSLTLLKNVIVNSEQVIHFDELRLFISGGSLINTEIFATVLHVKQNDQSFCKLKGYAEKLFIDIHDETEFNCFNLKSELCQVEATGYSEVMINCEKSLKLKVTGESNVYYTGEPKIAERIFSSNGFIVKRKAPTD